MVDFTRRRFLFGLAAAPVVAVVAKHFILSKFELPPAPRLTIFYGDSRMEEFSRSEGGYNNLPLRTGRSYAQHPTPAEYRQFLKSWGRSQRFTVG